MSAADPVCLEHDGSFPGFLCACAEALNAPEPRPRVVGRSRPRGLFEERMEVARDDARAASLWDRLARRIGAEAARTILSAYLSGKDGIDSSIALAVARLWRNGARELGDLADADMLAVVKAAYTATAESHKYKGLVRFSELADGSWYAPIEPRCDVLPLLGGHFAARYAPMRFAVHDVGRGTAILHEAGGPWTIVYGFSLGGDLDTLLSADEEAIRSRWRLYFESVAIGERRNPKLQSSLMPKRYWEHLTEL